MSVFEIITEEDVKQTPQQRKAKQWIDLGVEFSKAKAKGMTAKAFAQEKGIPYTTFTKSMSRYSGEIKQAIEIARLKGKSPKGLNKQQRAMMLINDFRASLTKTAKVSRPKEKSQEWFMKTIKAGVKGHQVVKPQVGRIYTYAYDPKYKDSLPFYDRFPLIICLGEGKSKAGNTIMLGLNLHYAPPKARQQFLEALLKQYATTPTLSNKTRLKIKWSDVKGMRGSDHMIKAYLPGHIQTKMIEIAPKDWHNIIMMPVYQFMSKGKKYDARKVWKLF
ncbi:DNA end protector protein [Shigella phage JK32]|nr:DNA end protector protein [Shigella phage JK32]